MKHEDTIGHAGLYMYARIYENTLSMKTYYLCHIHVKIIAMKSMNAADITTQHDNLFKVWFCVFPKSIFKLRSSVEIRN